MHLPLSHGNTELRSREGLCSCNLYAAGFGVPHIRQRSSRVAHRDYVERESGSRGWRDGNGAGAGWS